MKILYKFTFRNLLKNKTRTLVTIIGTFLAVSLLFVVGLIFSSIRDNMLQSAIEYGDHHVMISNEEMDDTLKKEIENNPKIDHFITIEMVDTILDSKYDREYSVRSASFDYDDNFVLAEGKLPTNNNEIIIERDLAETIDIKMGDTFSHDEIIYTVVGIYNSSKFDHYVHKSGYTDYSGILYTKSEGKYEERYYIYFKNIKDTYDETYKIAEKVGFSLLKNSSSNDNHYENVYLNTNYLVLFGVGNDKFVKLMRISITIVLSVLVLFCSLAIYNAFAISVSERKKIFGIFRSLGATKKNIFISVLYEAFIVAIIAIPLGLLFSFFLAGMASLIIKNYFSNIGFRVVIYPTYLMVSLIFSIIMIFLSALIPAFKSSRVSPMEAIRLNNETKIKKKKFKKNSVLSKLLGEEYTLARKNITRNKKKYRSAKISLIISIILFMVIGEFIHVVMDGIEEYEPEEYPISLYVEDSPKGKNLVKEIISYSEVDKYLVVRFLDGKIPFEKDYFTEEYLNYRRNSSTDYNNVNIVSYDQRNYNALKKKYKVKDDVIFVGKNYSYFVDGGKDKKTIPLWKDGIKTIDLYDVKTVENPNFTSSKDRYIYEYDINNPYYTLDNLYFVEDEDIDDLIVVSEDYFDRYKEVAFKYQSYYMGYFIRMDSKKYRDLNDRINQLESNNIEISNYTNELVENEDLYRMIYGIKVGIYAFLGFIILIAITNVINTINTNIDLRRRDFVVLKSIGLSNKSFNKMLFYEGLVLGTDSLILGQILANSLIFIILLTIYSNGDKVTYPFTYLIISIIGVYLIVFLTIYLASRKVKRANIIETIRNDNV